MIDSAEQAIRVQSRRRALGLKGRSKAVRRWFKRQHGRAVEAHGGQPPGLPVDWRDRLDGDFTGCRGWTEVHDPQWMNMIHRRQPVTPVVVEQPTYEAVMRVLNNKHNIVMEIARGAE